MLLVYQCFYGLAPTYLNDLVTVYKPTRHLRSQNKNLLIVPPISTKTYGERSFAHAAAVSWNKLPYSLKTVDTVEKFKTALKTYLFKMYLNSTK